MHQIRLNEQVVSDFERDPLHREVLRTHGHLNVHSRYDTKHRLIEQRTQAPTEQGNPAAPLYHSQYQWHPRGELWIERHQHRNHCDYQYDAAGRLRLQSNPVGQMHHFHWDGADNLHTQDNYDPIERSYVENSHLQGNRLLRFLLSKVQERLRFEYDPQAGRYLTPDPIGLAGGLNLYAYVFDPNSQIDPWGWSGCGNLSSQTAIKTYWPPNDGFLTKPILETLKKGYRFSRYGGSFDELGAFKDFGVFIAPENVPYSIRALPAGTNMKPLSSYEVVKPIPDVLSGPSAPYFGELGLGKQHRLPMTIQDYLDQGYIRLINRSVPKSL